MPAFEAIKLHMGEHSMMFQEETKVDWSGNDLFTLTVELKDGVKSIDLLNTNSTGEMQFIGRDTDNKLFTSDTIDAQILNTSTGDKYIVASWNSTGEAESYYLRVDTTTQDTVVKAKFTNQVTGDSKTAAAGNEVSWGQLDITVNNVSDSGTNKYINFSFNAGGSLNTLYTKQGLKMYLPWEANATVTTEGAINLTPGEFLTVGHSYDSWYLFFDEEDKEGNMGAGKEFNMTLDDTSDKTTVATVTTNGGSSEIGATDNQEYYVISDLATRIVHNTGGDQDEATVYYHGEQLSVNFFVSAPSVSVSGVEAGGLVLKDSEKTIWQARDVVLVGGSCINSATAEVLGVASGTCGPAFTTATGVGSGEYMIKSVGNFFTSGKLALVVAGYEKADTQAAASKLVNSPQDVDTAFGKEYRGKTGVTGSLAFSEVV